MPRARILWLSLLVAALAALLLLSERRAAAHRSLPTESPALANVAENADELTPSTAVAFEDLRVATPFDGAKTEIAPASVSKGERVALRPTKSSKPKEAWLEGRVIFPPGTPRDESVVVLAENWHFEKGDEVRVTVGPDGRFRVPYTNPYLSIRFEIEARTLHLPRSVRVTPARSKELLQLYPELAGTIVGRVLLPASLASLGQAVVSAGNRSAALSADHSFVLGSLPMGDYSLSLRCETPKGSVYRNGPEVHLVPGSVPDVTLDLRAEITLSGVVTDNSGTPLPWRTVMVDSRSAEGGSHGDSWSDEAGRFELVGLEPGDVSLNVDPHGESYLALGRVEAGFIRSDVRLVVERGHSLEGVIQAPTGSALTEVVLEVRDEQTGMKTTYRLPGIASPKQNARWPTGLTEIPFVLTGLSPGPFELEASASLIPDGSAGDKATWSHVQAAHLPSGTTHLRLRLERDRAR